MRNRLSRKLQLIVLLVLTCLVGTMSIAYAVLSTSLTITGNTEISSASWNIHFNNIQIDSQSVVATSEPKIVNTNSVDFAATLNKPGDHYTFTVDIVNSGTLDAMIDSVVKTPNLTEEQAKYISYEISYNDGNLISSKQILKKDSFKTLKVKIAYRNDIDANDLPSTSTNLNLSFSLVYIVADETAEEVTNKVTIPAFLEIITGDINTPGSEVAIGDEHFYVLSNNNSKLAILSKYNLHVGNYNDGISTTKPLENPTGIQDQNALGMQPDQLEKIGVTAFSTSAYWTSDSYPSYVYNSNSSLYTYIENYKTYLEGTGATIENARLITSEELEILGCSMEKYTCSSAPSWVYSTSYWTATAANSTTIHTVLANGNSAAVSYDNTAFRGVRPVIEIALS